MRSTDVAIRLFCRSEAGIALWLFAGRALSSCSPILMPAASLQPRKAEPGGLQLLAAAVFPDADSLLVQELTVRLGIVERKGHAQLIANIFGKSWLGCRWQPVLACVAGS